MKHAPDQIADFTLISPLADCSVGQVHRASKGGRPVAIKLARDARGDSGRLLRHEARFRQPLRHPQIVRYRAFGLTQSVDASSGRPWLATELETGPTLAQWMSGWAAETASPMWRLAAPPSWPEVVQFLIGLCRPLEYLHRQGRLHLDLSPGNIFVRDGKFPALNDFSLSRELHGVHVPFRESEFAAPAPYRAPEVRERAPLDPRTDLYALGALAFELLGGPAAPRGAWNETPNWLATLVERLVSERTWERPASAELLRRALEAGSEAPKERPASMEMHPLPPFPYPPRCRGRAPTQERLAHVVAMTRAGRGGLWLLAGAEGTGKTRLLEELWRSADLPVLVLPIANELAFLDERIRMEAMATGTSSSIDLAARFRRLDASTEARRRWARDVLAVLARPRGLLLLVDDWDRRPTWVQRLEPLGSHETRGPGGALSIVGSTRSLPEAVPAPCATTVTPHYLRLNALGPEVVDQILSDMLPASPGVPSWAHSILGRSRGNPRCLVDELQRGLRERAQLGGDHPW